MATLESAPEMLQKNTRIKNLKRGVFFLNLTKKHTTYLLSMQKNKIKIKKISRFTWRVYQHNNFTKNRYFLYF